MPSHYTVNNVLTRHLLDIVVGSYMKAGCSNRRSTGSFNESLSYAVVPIKLQLAVLLERLLVRSASLERLLALPIDVSLER